MFKLRKTLKTNDCNECLADKVKAARRQVVSEAKQRGDHAVVEQMMTEMLGKLVEGDRPC